MTVWWGTPKATSQRLQFEFKVMRRVFGNTFQLDRPNSGRYKGKICWVGDVDINIAVSENPGKHTLRVVYPDDYPNKPPEAYCERPKIRSKVHQYLDGELCLFNRNDGASHGWNPSKSTGVTIVGWAIQWFYAYYSWKATGDWPGLEETVPRRLKK